MPQKNEFKWGDRRAREMPEYASWCCMISRCYYEKDKEYARYGARGVAVCNEWHKDFSAFLAHIGPRPGPGYTVDRFPDPNGDYKPGNVRWATSTEQARSRRNAITVEYEGKARSLKEWSEITGIPYQTLYWRWKRGMTGAKLFGHLTKCVI